MKFQNIYGYGDLSPKPQERLLAFSYTFRRETPLGNEIYLSKCPGSFTFRIYVVMGIYLQTPRSGCFLFPAPSGGRRPLEMKYTYPSTLGHVLAEYIWFWEFISKTLGGVREQTNKQTNRQTEATTLLQYIHTYIFCMTQSKMTLFQFLCTVLSHKIAYKVLQRTLHSIKEPIHLPKNPYISQRTLQLAIAPLRFFRKLRGSPKNHQVPFFLRVQS